MAKSKNDLPSFCPASRQEWRAWLEEHHLSSPGVWLVYYKKGTGRPTVSYDEAVEEALCFGWIDSQVRSLDTERYQQLITPRKPGSVWSALNKRRVEALIEQGLMAPAGLDKIESAKVDGSWNSLDEVEALTVPADLTEALAGNPTAASNFTTFSNTSRKIILTWIASAKRPETRAKRIAETVLLAARNLRARIDNPDGK